MTARRPRVRALLCLWPMALLSCTRSEREIIDETVDAYCDRAMTCDPTLDRVECERVWSDSGMTADARGDACLRSWEALMLCVVDGAPCAEVPMPMSAPSCVREADGFASSCTEL